jgi:stage V sporulation protein AC
MDNSYKNELIKKHSPHSPLLKNCFLSFFFGGLICVIGELLLTLYYYFTNDKELSGILVTISLIFLASLLTALGIFDKIGRIAGAGTLVPVTGFSNAVVSEAMDSRSEGMILGVGSKIFTVAGPVILYGICSGVLYGVIYYVISLIGEVFL